MAERMCGRRIVGGVYATVPSSPDGKPVEFFLLDPPVVIDQAAFQPHALGVTLVPQGGVWHVMDWVGSNHYPFVADFVEEARHLGVSRRLPPSLDFSKLTPASRLVLLHQRAHIENHHAYQAEGWDCPKPGKDGALLHPCPDGDPRYSAEQLARVPMCAGCWWDDIEGEAIDKQGLLRRDLRGGLSYTGYARPEDVAPDYRLAAFMSLPIATIEVIRDPSDQLHEQPLERAEHSSLPVLLSDD